MLSAWARSIPVPLLCFECYFFAFDTNPENEDKDNEKKRTGHTANIQELTSPILPEKDSYPRQHHLQLEPCVGLNAALAQAPFSPAREEKTGTVRQQ